MHMHSLYNIVIPILVLLLAGVFITLQNCGPMVFFLACACCTCPLVCNGIQSGMHWTACPSSCITHICMHTHLCYYVSSLLLAIVSLYFQLIISKYPCYSMASHTQLFHRNSISSRQSPSGGPLWLPLCLVSYWQYA